MKLSKGKIILIVIVLYFAYFAVVNINKEKDINKDILDKVVIVNDGVLDVANDGKLVLVSGKVSYDNLVSFIELDENFGTIKINRKVEDFIKTNDDNNEDRIKWVERKEPLDNTDNNYLNQLVSEEKISNVRIGDYELDEKGLSLIPTDSYYSKQDNIGELTTTGIYYERDPWEEDLIEGDIRLTYKYYDLDKNPDMSILAVQKDNSFIPYYVDKKNSIYQVFVGRVDSKDKLSKELDLNVKRTTKGKILFIIMIIGIGIFFIVDNRKK